MTPPLPAGEQKQLSIYAYKTPYELAMIEFSRKVFERLWHATPKEGEKHE